MNTENNKIIAEFLGANFQHNEFFFPTMVFKEGKNFFNLEELKFHNNWNWLMELVEKIFSTVDEKREDDVDWDYLTKAIRDSFYFPTKDNVYNCCLDFIKWHNEQKQN